MSARSVSRSPSIAPSPRAWTSTLPTAVASTGPATTGSSHASAVSWQSSVFRAPPPTIARRRSTDPTGAPPHATARAYAAPGCRGCSGPSRPDVGHRTVGPSTGLLDPAPACHPAAGRPASSGSIDGPPGGSAAAAPRTRQDPPACPRAPMSRMRLLEQPETHDVAQVADPPVRRRASFVNSSTRLVLGQDRRARARRPTSDHVPARDVGEPIALGRHPDDRRRRVVRPDRGTRTVDDRPVVVATSSRNRPITSPGRAASGTSPRGRPSASISSSDHSAGRGVDEARRRGVRALRRPARRSANSRGGRA